MSTIATLTVGGSLALFALTSIILHVVDGGDRRRRSYERECRRKQTRRLDRERRLRREAFERRRRQVNRAHPEWSTLRRRRHAELAKRVTTRDDERRARVEAQRVLDDLEARRLRREADRAFWTALTNDEHPLFVELARQMVTYMDEVDDEASRC